MRKKQQLKRIAGSVLNLWAVSAMTLVPTASSAPYTEKSASDLKKQVNQDHGITHFYEMGEEKILNLGYSDCYSNCHNDEMTVIPSSHTDYTNCFCYNECHNDCHNDCHTECHTGYSDCHVGYNDCHAAYNDCHAAYNDCHAAYNDCHTPVLHDFCAVFYPNNLMPDNPPETTILVNFSNFSPKISDAKCVRITLGSFNPEQNTYEVASLTDITSTQMCQSILPQFALFRTCIHFGSRYKKLECGNPPMHYTRTACEASDCYVPCHSDSPF